MEGKGVELRKTHACDFCRIHRKKCMRPSPTAKCGYCEQYRYTCSKDRTIKELLEILHGPQGVLRSETPLHFFRPSFPTPQTPSGPFDGASSPSPFEHASTSAYSPVALDLALETPYNATGYEATHCETNRVASLLSFNDNVNNASVGGVHGPNPSSNITCTKASQYALELFEKLRAHRLTSKDIASDAEIVRSVDPYCSLHASLETLAALIERKSIEVITEIEKIGYDADDKHWADQAQWIYTRLLQEVDQNHKFPQERRRALLLRIARFYQRLGAPSEVGHILDQVVNLSNSLSTSDDAICSLRIEALRKATQTASDNFAKLPVQQVPLDFRSRGAPVPFVHHILRYGSPNLILKVLDGEARGTEPPVNLIQANPFHIAAQDGDTTFLQLLAKIYRSGIDGRDSLSRTPLFLAALNGHYEACELLLNYNAEKNARSITNQTVIEVAARQGHIHIVKALYDRGADVNPLPMEGGSTPLQAAAESGHLNIVQYLLDTGKVNLSIQRFGDCKTAKDLANEQGHKNIVSLLEVAYLFTQTSHDFSEEFLQFNG